MAIRELHPILAKKALDELGEDREKVPEYIAILKTWVSQQPHLNNIRTSDQWLLSHLRRCKFSLEKTKMLLDNFYAMRSLHPEFAMNLDPFTEKQQELLNYGFVIPLPDSENIGDHRVMLVRTSVGDSTKYSFNDIMKMVQMFDLYMINEDDRAMVNGVVMLIDCGNSIDSFKHHLNFTSIRTIAMYSNGALALRFKRGHYINVPRTAEAFFLFLKNFRTEEQNRRVFFHREVSELYEHIPKSILPKEYGGENVSVKEMTENWKKRLENYKPVFDEEQNYKSDESKRPGKPKTSEDMYGVKGSFRKLNVD